MCVRACIHKSEREREREWGAYIAQQGTKKKKYKAPLQKERTNAEV